MPDVTDAILDRMIRTIVDEVDPEQVILFGSRARGDARSDSDIDLLIIESEPFGAAEARTTRRSVSVAPCRQARLPGTSSFTAATRSSAGAAR